MDGRVLRGRLRDVGVACVSLLVVTGAIAFVMAPTSVVFAASVTAASYADSRASVVYGKAVHDTGAPVRVPRVRVYHLEGGEPRTDRVLQGRWDGGFRDLLWDKPAGYYYVEISKRLEDGRVAKGRVRFYMRPGQSYRIQATIVRRSWISFLPVTHY